MSTVWTEDFLIVGEGMILCNVLCVPFVGAVGSRVARGLPVL